MSKKYVIPAVITAVMVGAVFITNRGDQFGIPIIVAMVLVTILAINDFFLKKIPLRACAYLVWILRFIVACTVFLFFWHELGWDAMAGKKTPVMGFVGAFLGVITKPSELRKKG